MSRSSTPASSWRLSGLLRDQEAASLLSEAWHRDALAEESANACAEAANTMLDARRRWDDLRHRLDPRDRRLVKIRTGLAVLVLITACLLMLDVPIMRGVTAQHAIFPLAICATATWLMAAWRSVLADRENQRRLRVLIAAGTAVLILLLAVVHVLASANWQPLRWQHVATTAAIMILIGALTAAATALISRIEPPDVAAARASWRHARKRHLKAQRRQHEDTEAASAARRAWLEFVTLKASEMGRGDGERDDLVAGEMLAEAERAVDRSRHGSCDEPGQ
jgi:hypothetical protein